MTFNNKKIVLGSIQINMIMEKTPDYIVENNKDVEKKYKWLKNKLKEHFYAIYLNGKNRIIGDKLICLGTTTASLIDIQDIVRTALLTNASAVIILHNHPSGDPGPSSDDIDSTHKIHRALGYFNIKLLDHIIIGAKQSMSMNEAGMIKTQ